MSLSGELNAIISQVFSAILLVAQASAVILWNLLLSEGFDPAKSYQLILNPNVDFFTSYESFLSNSLPEITGVILAAFAIYIIFKSSLSETPGNYILYRPIFSVILSIFSIELIQGMLSAEMYIYDPIWNSGVNWSSLILQTSPTGLVSGNGLVRLFLIAGYDVPMISIFIVLSIRTALLLFSYLVLPFVSLLLMFPPAEKYSVTLWKTVVEASFLPIFMLLALYPMYIVQGNTVVQIGSLFLCSSIPILFVERSRIFSNMTGSLTSAVIFGSILERNSIPEIAAGNLPGIQNVSTSVELFHLGMPNSVDVNYGVNANPYAVDWNAAYQRSYSEAP